MPQTELTPRRRHAVTSSTPGQGYLKLLTAFLKRPLGFRKPRTVIGLLQWPAVQLPRKQNGEVTSKTLQRLLKFGNRVGYSGNHATPQRLIVKATPQYLAEA